MAVASHTQAASRARILGSLLLRANLHEDCLIVAKYERTPDHEVGDPGIAVPLCDTYLFPRRPGRVSMPSELL
jgi:hypothetical protein